MVFIEKQKILSIFEEGGKRARGWQNSPGLRYYKFNKTENYICVTANQGASGERLLKEVHYILW